MTTEQHRQMEGPEQLEEFPLVDLDWAYDDVSNASTLTVFDPQTPDIASAWITVDNETAVSLDRVR